MISSLFYLQACSFWNRLVTRVKRLKNPKYLFGLIVGLLWFYWYFVRALGLGRNRVGKAMSMGDWSEFAPALELLGALLLLVIVLASWIFAHERAALVFTEAETAFLFPAPISRRTLLHFKLLKSQFGIFVTTFFFALISMSFGARGSLLMNLAGWWVILSILNLHFLGCSFARTQLLDRGFSNWKRRAVIFALLALALGAVLWWARDTMRPPNEAETLDFKKLARYGYDMLQAGPAPWLLWPFRLVVRPFFAADAGTFLASLWPALFLLVLHYVWVIRSNVAFEEASIALAQKRAQLISNARQGNLTPASHKARRDPFVLHALGPPAVALLWKNLVAAGSLFRARVVIMMGIVLSVMAVSMSLSQAREGIGTVVGIVLGMALLWSIMLGPMILRYDFRADLKSMDVLKLYPLPGWRVVLGELLTPAIILTIVQWLLLLVGVIAVNLPKVKEFGFPQRLSIAVGAAIILPMLNLISFLIPNAAVLLFPAWFQSGQDGTQGLEATGQRLIFALGQFLVFLVALVPAGLAFALVFFVVKMALPWPLAVPLGAVPACLILGAEAAVGIGMLGKVFEKFDLSSEPQS